IQRAVLAGDEVTGITLMRMEEGLDTGPMLFKMITRIDRKSAGQLTDELAKLGALALAKWLDVPTAPEPQPEIGVTYAKKIDKAEARIDWSASAKQIERQVRPFMGWQRQEHGPSVQQTLEEALARMTGKAAQFIGAGRTDAGVHALAMSAHVDIAPKVTPHRLREGLNALVRPHPVSILEVEPV